MISLHNTLLLFADFNLLRGIIVAVRGPRAFVAAKYGGIALRLALGFEFFSDALARRLEVFQLMTEPCGFKCIVVLVDAINSAIEMLVDGFLLFLRYCNLDNWRDFGCKFETAFLVTLLRVAIVKTNVFHYLRLCTF